MSRVVVIGGGICGAAAALTLARSGQDVMIVERSDSLGGLVTSFSVGGTPVEIFYHHLIPNELDILELLRELGLDGKVSWFDSRVAVFTQGRMWGFTGPLDLLRFKPLPLIDRIRTGLGALRFGPKRDWRPLDQVPAVKWLADITSKRASREIWTPLLQAKFGPAAGQVPAAWMWARMKQRALGRKRGKEVLGYLRGGFKQMFQAIEKELVARGAEVRIGSGVDQIVTESERVTGVTIGGQFVAADAVLFAGQLPALPRLLPEELHDERWTRARGLGVICAVLELNRALTHAFWTNVCDSEIPFGGIIELTDLVPASDYQGRHIVYLSRYFLPEEPIAKVDPTEEAHRWVGILEAKVPGFTRDMLLGVHGFRASYAAPLVTLNYQAQIPPIESHVAGLYVATTAQIYPEDRGMSEGVRMGNRAARIVLKRRESVTDAS